MQHLSQFTTSYGPEHWTAIKHVLRYLKGTRDLGITFQSDVGLGLEIFVDSDYVNRADARSIGGYAGVLGGGCVAWSSKKQQMVSLSMTEAEYIVLTEGAKQLIWLQCFLSNIAFEQTNPTSLCSDNLGAIILANDATYHAHMKHINVSYHFICKRVAFNKAVLTYVQLKENPADIMTKGLDLPQHHHLNLRLGLIACPEVKGSVVMGTLDTSDRVAY